MAENPMAGAPIFLFAGPTLPAEPDAAWRDLLARVQVRPPARRGDILNALCDEPSTLVLVDGFFYTVPSVTHKELLYALESGVRVLGAASMGALRAAELEIFGMEGVGTIFRRFRDGELDGDDEVTVLHGPAEAGYRALSMALVDVRCALERRVAAEEIPMVQAAALVARLKALPFSERQRGTLLRLAAEILGEEGSRLLLADLETFSQKTEDAREALERALAGASERAPKGIAAGRGQDLGSRTIFLGNFCEWHLRLPADVAQGDRPGELEPRPTFLDAWSSMQILHPEAPALVTGLRRRFLAATAARRAGWEPPAAEVARLAEDLRKGLVEHHGHPLLPAREREAEALLQARSELAQERLGGIDGALSHLAESFGLRSLSHPRLVELLALQEDLLPAWSLLRAAVFCPAFRQAIAVARQAKALHRAFLTWSQGQTVDQADLRTLAARLWRCQEEELPAQAAARHLFDSRGFSPGLWQLLEFLAPAELLPKAINDYPKARASLLATPLDHPFLEAAGASAGRASAARTSAGTVTR